MAEEEKDNKQHPDDEEIIIIEDEEEQEKQKEQKETIAEEHAEDKETENLDIKGEIPKKKKSKLMLIGGVAALIVVIIAAAALTISLFHKKAPQPKPKKQVTIHKKQIKKKMIENKPTAYNPIFDVHFIKAMRLQEKGEYKEAIEQLKQATVDLYVSYYGIAYIYLKMGELHKAKEYLFDKTKNYLILAIHNNPKYINGYVNLFRIYMATRDYKDALSMINQLKRLNMDQKDVQLMETYYNYVANNERKNVFELLSEYPNSPLLLSLAGDYYLENGNANGAIRYFKKAINLYPIGSVYYNLALIQTQNNQPAIKIIPKMYYMDIDKIPCKNYLAFFLLLKNNKFNAAENFINLNKTYKPQCFKHFKIIPIATSQLTVKSYAIRKNFNFIIAAEILNMYLLPIDILPQKSNPNIQLAMVYQNLGISKKAVQQFTKAAKFSEAALLTQYANKFYKEGNYKKSLYYYKLALQKAPSNPLLIYDVGIMSLKNHDTDTAKNTFERLISTYPSFPLPYLGMFVIDQIKGKHMDSMKYLDAFGQRLKSLDKNSQDKLKDLSVFSDYIIDRINFNPKELKKLNSYQKKIFLLFKAALNLDTDYLEIQEPLERKMHLYWNASSIETICEYFFNTYQNDFIKRMMAKMYLMNNKPQKAYEAMYNISTYSAEDYYILGVSYLLNGYPDIADNFFTKSILKGTNFFNAYAAKAIIQAQKGSLTGIQYYLKIILKKQASFAWLNTDILLSYKIMLQ